MSVVRLGSAALLALLFTSASAIAQDSAGAPRLRLFLPPGVPAEKIEIRYNLFGAFGAYGNFAKAKADATYVEVPLAVNGTIAQEIKGFAWGPGCRVMRFDLTVKDLDFSETYTCDLLAFVLLTGKIEESPLRQHKTTELQVEYLANWSCDFFELSDCMVPQFEIGIVKVDPTGQFEVSLPNFAADPGCEYSRLPGNFELVLRDVKTHNPVAALSPRSKAMRSLDGALKSASVYPHPVIFDASKPR